MPYNNVPKSLWKKMDDCVEQVMKQGKDKETAIKICYSALKKKYKFDSEALWLIEEILTE